MGLPFSRYYSSQDYQGGIQNYAIAQNSLGLIYVANNFGLLEYDGVHWRRYILPNNSKIRHLNIGTDGKIFVTGQGEFGYFSPSENGQLLYTTLVDRIPDAFRNLEEVWKVYTTHESVIFCTLSEIFVFDKNLMLERVIQATDAFESFHLSKNRLIVNERGQGLSILTGDRLSPIPGLETFKDKLVTGLVQVTDTNWKIYTRDHGIFSLSGENIIPRADIHPALKSINAALLLRNGQTAIGTQLNGVFILDDNGKVVLHIDISNGLNNNTVISLFEDLSGNLWIGHANGITLLQLGLPFEKIDQYSGIDGTGYHAKTFAGKTYLGTNHGIFYYDENTKGLHLAESVEGSNGQVYQIQPVKNHLLAAHNDGAFQIKDRKAYKIEGPSGIWNFQSLPENTDLILSGGYNGLYLFDAKGDDIKFLRKLEGFQESSRVLEFDQRGNIWMAHGYKGIYKLKISEDKLSLSAQFYGTAKGLPSHSFNNIWRIQNQPVFTTEEGFYQYNQEKDQFEKDLRWDQYFAPDILIHFMVEDAGGNIYFIASDQVGVLERKVDGSFVKHTSAFNGLLPLLNDDLQNISVLHNKEVLFAANDGFIRFDFTKTLPSPPVFPTLIRSVFLTGTSDSLVFSGHPFQPSGFSKVPIPYKKAHLRFECSNPTPNNEKDLQFQFWLEGHESGYGDWGYKNDKSYTNLREGEYTLHVQSKNLHGAVSPEATYRFRVLPPWYRSRVAFAFYFACFIMAGFMAYRIVDKRFEKKATQIKSASKKVIEQKESELKMSQAELEKLKSEKLEVEIAGKNKELATATMHLINKNSFIDHMKGHLNTIVRKSKNQEVKNEIQKLVKNIEKNIAEDRDWEQFEIHFDQVHGDFMNRFKKYHPGLSPQEIKLSAYLRMNLSSKEIAFLMNISPRGVEIARYRLRKKLKLDRAENLQEFILNF
ncbi:MAG: regulator [Cyclobacteriaceae bacterium]|nr:regulator [Cyclobacteriaceae bacterium]